MIEDMKMKVPRKLLESIDLLVKAGVYPNRNEAIRDSIRQNLKGEAS